MSMEKTLKEILDEILDEVEKELDEATATGNVAGYQTPYAFGNNRKKDKKKEKETATQAGYTLAESINEAKIKKVNKSKWNRMKFDDRVTALLSVVKDPDDAEEYAESKWEDLPSGFERDMVIYESVNESKTKRPVNRWLELKNDESMHPHKKMAMGLKELKYQLREVEKFFNWYNRIKTMNELDSQQ